MDKKKKTTKNSNKMKTENTLGGDESKEKRRKRMLFLCCFALFSWLVAVRLFVDFTLNHLVRISFRQLSSVVVSLALVVCRKGHVC